VLRLSAEDKCGPEEGAGDENHEQALLDPYVSPAAIDPYGGCDDAAQVDTPIGSGSELLRAEAGADQPGDEEDGESEVGDFEVDEVVGDGGVEEVADAAVVTEPEMAVNGLGVSKMTDDTALEEAAMGLLTKVIAEEVNGHAVAEADITHNSAPEPEIEDAAIIEIEDSEEDTSPDAALESALGEPSGSDVAPAPPPVPSQSPPAESRPRPSRSPPLAPAPLAPLTVPPGAAAAESQASFNELPPPSVALDLRARQLRALLVDRVCSDHDMEYAELVGRLRALMPLPSGMPSDVASKTATNDVDISTTAEVCGEVPAEYSCTTAPLALLRAYAAQDRWLSINCGNVIFEDDFVEFPASTLTPIREHPWESPPLNLVSLWLVVALRGRYGDASPHIFHKHGATHVDAKYSSTLLRFLRGEEHDCELVMSKAEYERLPRPEPHRLRLQHRASAPTREWPVPLDQETLSSIATPKISGSSPSSPSTAAAVTAASSKSRPSQAKPKTDAGGHKAAVATKQAAVPKLMAQRLERLRLDCEKLFKDRPSTDTGSGSAAKEEAPSTVPQASTQVELLRQECLRLAREAGKAQVVDKQLQEQERVLKRRLEDLGDTIAATSRRLHEKAAKRKQLSENFHELRLQLTTRLSL
jgi:hypothetical protein